MTIENQLAAQLLEIPEIEKRELGRSKMWVCGSKEIARYSSGGGTIDIKLTHPLICALGLVGDETETGWVRMNVREQTDFPAVIALVQRAVKTSKFAA